MIVGTARTGSRENQQVHRGQARDDGRGPRAGLHEHAVLQRRADRAAAGSDLRERVAGELRGDHRGPRRADGHVLQPPQAAQRRDLQRGHRSQPARAELVEVLPGGEEVEQAGEDEVQRDRGDREPDAPAHEPPARGRLRLTALDDLLDVGAVLDRALDPISNARPRRHRHARHAPSRQGGSASPPSGDSPSPAPRRT
jgi:hypothetical protein